MKGPPVSNLRFGIPSLDFLFSPGIPKAEHQGIQLPMGAEMKTVKGVTSLCIEGSTGTGKSLLALHLVSRYLADCVDFCKAQGAESPSSLPAAIYVSTDLTYARAADTWSRFGLGHPNRRNVPYSDCGVPKREDAFRELIIDLQPGSGTNPKELAETLATPVTVGGEGAAAKVLFLDLAEETAGDDWNLIAKTLSLLEPRNIQEQPAHLLVIDAVEGLEMLAGQTDAHGQERSRRSRIAQLLRLAVGKCHIALVLEDERDLERPAEEYVTDAVLRLRQVKEDNYLRRTMEVVKSRGHSSVRGVHQYTIRSGGASSPNPLPRYFGVAPDVQEPARGRDPDDPSVPHPVPSSPYSQAYIEVFHSLDCLTRYSSLKADKETTGAGKCVAAFPAPLLPGILLRNGLPRGSVTVLTGDEATNKGRFGLAFLSGCFAPDDTGNFDDPPLRGEMGDEVAVLITTANRPREAIVDSLGWHSRQVKTNSGRSKDDFRKTACERLIYRQIEVHHLTGPILFNIIRRCVEQAIIAANRLCTQLPYGGTLQKPWVGDLYSFTADGQGPAKRIALSERSAKVRVVIDDWSVIQASYPSVAKDSLFLPFLVRYLEALGVTALIIETQPGRPDQAFSSYSGRELRALVGSHLHTWHVQFYGEQRVAIAAIPSHFDRLPSVVAELRPPVDVAKEEPDERLHGDRVFELYRNLDTGKPEPVVLSVKLFAAAANFKAFELAACSALEGLFSPQAGQKVVTALAPQDYSNLRDISIMDLGRRDEYTTVITVDEYWPSGRRHSRNRVMHDTAKYLHHATAWPVFEEGGDVWRWKAIPRNDAFSVFQPDCPPSAPLPGGNGRVEGVRKKDFFSKCLCYGSSEDDGEWWKDFDTNGLVPYVWDFGLVLLRHSAWHAAMRSIEAAPDADSTRPDVQLGYDSIKLIKEVWWYCTGEKPPPGPEGVGSEMKKVISWKDFLKACRLVARVESAQQPARMFAFDIELLTSQTLACLVLEMWLSEIIESLSGEVADRKKTLGLGHFRRIIDVRRPSLTTLLAKYRFEFFKVWLLIGEAVDPVQLVDEQGQLTPHRADNKAVASRHWYSTGSDIWKGLHESDGLRPGRLPGHFSTRGDWFLMISPESRSHRLGELALDLLSRRSSVLTRLECGVGLPVRDLWGEEGDAKHIRTALGTVDMTGVRQTMSYQELLGLCGGEPAKFQPGWLWRSQIEHYNLHDRIFERWLGKLLREAARVSQSLRSRGISSIELHNLVKRNGQHVDVDDKVEDVAGFVQACWQQFDSMAKAMSNELKMVEPQPQPSAA